MIEEPPETLVWLRELEQGDPDSLAALYAYYRPRLDQMLRLRMGAMAGRVDTADVLQEVYIDAAQQLRGYLRQREVGFYVWLRKLTWERLLKLQRRHLGTQRRAAWREVSLPTESSISLAQQLVAHQTSPSEALVRDELKRRVQNALNGLSEDNREVILMRDFEGMSNGEVAQTLGLSDSGATKRYGRAIFRLKETLEGDLAGGEST